MRVADHRIAAPRGRLFARSWHPEGAKPHGPTILLIHDSLGCVELWRDFPARLAQVTRRPVVAYDRLGFGRSDPHPGLLSPDFIEQEGRAVVPALCDQLGIATLIPLGHSVGGGMALGTAAHLPDRCPAAVTVAAQAFVEGHTLDGVRHARTVFRDSAQFERLARYHGDKARWVLDAWIETWLAPGFASWSLDDTLPQVRCPLLAILGEHDEYVSARHLERIAARATGPVEAVTLPDCGHVPHRECPDRLLGAIAGFLA